MKQKEFEQALAAARDLVELEHLLERLKAIAERTMTRGGTAHEAIGTALGYLDTAAGELLDEFKR